MSIAVPDMEIVPRPIPDWSVPVSRSARLANEFGPHLRELVQAYAVANKDDLVAKTCCRALERLERKDYQTAAELFALAAEFNNVLEFAFLGAALANRGREHLPAAQAYASQALTLHRLLGTGALVNAYLDFVIELSPKKLANDKLSALPQTASEPKSEFDENPWYWQFARRHPKRDDLISQDSFDAYFFDGLLPAAPYLTRSDRIGTIGSCFAQNIATHLTKLGYQTPANTRIGTIDHVYISDNFFNTFVIREAFEYAFGMEPNTEHWIRDGASGAKRRANQISYSIETVRSALERADVYVVTLGLAEVWFNRKTNVVYPGGVNIDSFDPETHGFRVSSVEENFDNLSAIYDLIRRQRPHATIIFTLSPVPLGATFRPFNCIAANSVSKAVLRLAIDRLMVRREADERLFYYPSYEIVRDYFSDAFGNDMRHVKDNVIGFVMDQFLRKFFIE